MNRRGLSPKEQRAGSLRTWNFIVAGVHGASFVALLIITLATLPTGLQVSLWQDYDGASIVNLATYPISITLLPFPFLTAIFHLLAAFNVDNYYNSVLCFGVNRLRWVEYALTNGLIVWSRLTLVGAGNIFIPFGAALSNVLMQYLGFRHEVANHPPNSRGNLTPLILGFLPFFVIWTPTLSYHIANIATAKTYEIVAIFGSLLFALLFVAPLIYRYTQRGARDLMGANYTEELMYIILSVTAKLFLDWTIVIGNLVDP